MFANMTNDLFIHGRIKTTLPKAKALRRRAERMITLGKASHLAARRRAMAFMRNKAAVAKLFNDIAPGFMDRSGGYTRILRLKPRVGDCAPMSIIELVEGASVEGAVEKKPADKKAAVKKKVADKKAADKKKAAAKKVADKKASDKKKAADKDRVAKKAFAKKSVAASKAKPAARRTAVKKTTKAK